MRFTARHTTALLTFTALLTGPAFAGDQPQWGQRHTRNQVSDETGLPEGFNPETGANVKWSVPLGDETYATTVVANGRVFIGTNNRRPRDPKHQGDRSVMLCLDEKDGRLLWQLVVPKLASDPYLDWPGGGIVSPPTVEGDRVYVVSNRAEVLCLDIHGLANGNDGPFTDEGKHMAPDGAPPMQPGPLDADILWRFDLREGVGMYPHDAAHSSVLLYGRHLYINTCNGVDNTHRKIRAPDAPSLIVLDKAAGKLLAQDQERIGPRIFHSTWSSPALGQVNGKTLIFFGGGDGVCYAFEALPPDFAGPEVAALKRVWRFDCDPTGPKEEVHRYTGNRREGPSNIKGMPVFHNNRIYVAAAGDVWWGKNEAVLKCIDATQTGDITRTGEVWSYPLNRHCMATPAIHDGLLYITDLGSPVKPRRCTLHCVEADTGKAVWTHEAAGEFWGSPLVADGKVYCGSQGGDFWVLAAGREKKVLSTVRLDSGITATPVAANGVLYVATQKTLYALSKK